MTIHDCPPGPEHGEAVPIPPGDHVGVCDWGACDEPAAFYRFDAWGHGWLPCCARCVLLPAAFDEQRQDAALAADLGGALVLRRRKERRP